ncbi:Cro/CI family transcriptional regulator [Halomonas elongata]|uniref:Cro/CI family transcriptional regulator n=1 Tax=Halomonas elongata TaxID=2746 RepID=UPI00186B8D5F|nr:Cro/CI family transcriptional regulator [Halomonas elongata]MBW5800093.1 Cro/Cl family transcriptional regulator [Halomonas elongata]
MTKQDVLDYFGGTVAAAKALGRTKGAVSQWVDPLPQNLQFEIEGRTRGKLKARASQSTREANAQQRA